MFLILRFKISNIKIYLRPAINLYSNYNQSVYTLVWSLPLANVPVVDLKNSYILYSVADGKIMQHSFKLSQNSVTNIETVDFYDLIKSQFSEVECGLTELAVFIDIPNDIIYLTIGKFDGSIEVYKLNRNDNQLVKLCTFLNHKKLITIIKWHKNGNYFASGSNDYNVVIIDFKTLMENLNASGNEDSKLKLISNYKHKLVGHRERITGLSWSIHDEGLLASCSYDATVQVIFFSTMFKKCI